MNIADLQIAFEKKGYLFRYFPRMEEAATYLDNAIDGKTVGFGDSHTLYDMGLYELLQTHNDGRSPMHLQRNGPASAQIEPLRGRGSPDRSGIGFLSF